MKIYLVCAMTQLEAESYNSFTEVVDQTKALARTGEQVSPSPPP